MSCSQCALVLVVVGLLSPDLMAADAAAVPAKAVKPPDPALAPVADVAGLTQPVPAPA